MRTLHIFSNSAYFAKFDGMLPAGASFAFSVGAHLARDSKLILKHVFKLKTPANSSIFSIFWIIYAENLASQKV